jgi:NADH:ubiquinone oxidoreductase subunit 6 (subunit J)
MPRRLFEAAFIASAILLVALVGAVNCLQGTFFVGGLKCQLNYTSSDLTIKALATLIFLIFLGLLVGPIVLTLIPQLRGRRTGPRRIDKT